MPATHDRQLGGSLGIKPKRHKPDSYEVGYIAAKLPKSPTRRASGAAHIRRNGSGLTYTSNNGTNADIPALRIYANKRHSAPQHIRSPRQRGRSLFAGSDTEGSHILSELALAGQRLGAFEDRINVSGREPVLIDWICPIAIRTPGYG